MKPSSITSSVEENSRKHERELRQAEQRLSEAHERGLRLEHLILEGLGKVAAAQLDNADAFSKDVARELSERRDEEAKLRQDLQNVEVSIGSLNEMATELASRVETLTVDVNRALAVDASYISLLQGQEQARARLQAYKAQEVEISSECKTKLAAFNKSPVFTYLWNAKHGTEQYRGKFLIRALDGWLAAQIHFAQNAANYRMLQAMQDANLTRQAELKEEADIAEEMVKTAAQRSFEAAGLPTMQSRLASVREKITTHKRSANWFHTSLGKFALRTDAHSKKAQELILSSLRTRTFDEIQALVKQSTSSADDQASARVATLQRALAEHHKEVHVLKEQRDKAEEHYNRAKELERTLRSGRYIGSQYQYERGSIDSLILGYMIGNLDTNSFEKEVERHQETFPQHDTWSTGSGGSVDSGGSVSRGGDDSITISDTVGSVIDSVTTTDSY